MPEVASDRRAALRPWLGVAIDVALTALLLALGVDPVFSLVQAHQRAAALALGALHLAVVPAGQFVGLLRSKEMGIFDDSLTAEAVARQPLALRALGRATEASFLMFYVLGWMLPLGAFSITSRVPSALMAACMVIHVAPIVLVVLLALLGLDRRLDGVVERLSGPRAAPLLALLFAAYLAVVEAFLLLLSTSRRSAAELTLPIWALSYLPTRLLLARLTGLRGPERWTFAASCLHLLARLLLARAG